jgi:Methyltransferase domain
MTRSNIIQGLIDKYKYKKYLEIGVNNQKQPGYNWVNILCETKHGVDPNIDTTFKMTSDEFFAQNKETYDIIFIDGLHLYEQVYKDILNSLAVLNDNGTIVVHDCNPIEEITQREIRASDAWHGSVWKSIARLRVERHDLDIKVIDTDEGCAIIRRGKHEPFNVLRACRKELLGLITKEEWVQSQ